MPSRERLSGKILMGYEAELHSQAGPAGGRYSRSAGLLAVTIA